MAILLLLLALCSGAPVASGWQALEAQLLWQGFRLPEAGTAPGQESGRKSNPSLLAFTLVPPSQVYYYDTQTTEGLPTQVTAIFAPVSPFSGKPVPATTAFSALLDEKGADLKVRTPQAVPKKETGLGSAPGLPSDDDNLLVYVGPMTFWVELPSLQPFYTNAILEVTVKGLFCTEVSCSPFENTVQLVIDGEGIAAFPQAADQLWWTEWQEGTAVQLPVYVPSQPEGTPDGSEGEGLPHASEPALEAGPDQPDSVFAALEPRYSNPSLEVEDLGGALLFGLLAGLILNLMPCVLPVVSLKFTALMAVSAMENKQEKARAFRTHCLIFASGILTWFLVLAFLLGSAGWAWGEMFQSPHLVAVLGMVMFLLGLSLFGVFTLPILDLKVTSDRHPHFQAFASGLLATLLATPCSGPLLGGVLGWALRQPQLMLILAITSVGIGMALPYIILALNPRLVHLLPRPGAWTLRLEQLLGFFLMGSVVYMVTLLPESWVTAFLFSLVAVAIAGWLWGQIGHLGASRTRRIVARLLAVLLVTLAALWSHFYIDEDFAWEPFDLQVFMEDLGKEPILVEFTADWCPSCKAMEQTTLSKSRMTALQKKYNMRTIRVDMTREDPVAKEFLLALGSGSIPVIALFPAGENASNPLVLRDIVTPAQLDEALARVF